MTLTFCTLHFQRIKIKWSTHVLNLAPTITVIYNSKTSVMNCVILFADNRSQIKVKKYQGKFDDVKINMDCRLVKNILESDVDASKYIGLRD